MELFEDGIHTVRITKRTGSQQTPRRITEGNGSKNQSEYSRNFKVTEKDQGE